jgi:hypothetical protein
LDPPEADKSLLAFGELDVRRLPLLPDERLDLMDGTACRVQMF